MPSTQTDLISTSSSIKPIPVTIGEGASISAPVYHESSWAGVTVRSNSTTAVNRFLSKLKSDFTASTLKKLIGTPKLDRQLQLVAEGAQINAPVTVTQIERGMVIELMSEKLPVEQLRFWQLPGANPDFVGRTEQLKTLAGQLQQCQQSLIGQSVSGLGGTGKTQLALAFATQHLRQSTDRVAPTPGQRSNDGLHYDAILWLCGRDLANETVALASALSLDTATFQGAELCKKLCLALCPLGPQVLLVFDDVAKESTLSHWVAGIKACQETGADDTRFHVLATSRSERWKKWPTLALTTFSQDEARDFIQRRLPDTTVAQANALANLVHYFPLALAQAVAYIETHDKTIAEYCHHYQTYQKRLLEKPLDSDNSAWDATDTFFQDKRQRAVYSTWELSVEALREHCPLAETVLNLCAFLAPEGIPTFLITNELLKQDQGLLSLDPITWDEVCLQLRQHSLVTYHAETTFVDKKIQFPRLDIHQLLQEVIRLQLQQQTITDKKAESHLEGLPQQPEAITEPHHQNESPTKITHCYDRYGAYVLAKIAPLLGYDMADATSLQRVNMLYAHNEQIARLAEKADWDRPLTARLWGTLGNYQQEVVGNAHAGRDCQERALRLKEAYYGKDHVEVAKTLNNLAGAYDGLGDSQAKKDALERALPLLEKHYGPEHLTIAIATDNLATAYGALGDHQTEKTMLERALSIKEAYYGQDHVEVAITLNNLAAAYYVLGKMQRAKAQWERALPLLEKHYGPKHPTVATAVGNLACAYGVLGDHQTEKTMLACVLTTQEAYYGQDHIEVAKTLNNLATAYGRLGDSQAKKDTLERALPLLEKQYGPEHPDVAVAYNNLATAYGDLGDHQTKKTMLERILRIQEAYYGKDHVEVAKTQVSLANAYGALGDHQTKKTMLEHALRLKEAYYGQDHVEVAKTQVSLANAYGNLGDHQTEKTMLERILCIQEAYYGQDHVEVAKTLNNLANAHGDLGDSQAKKDTLERALPLLEKHYGPAHPAVATAYNNLANAYGDLGDHQTQKTMLERTLTIQEAYYGKDHIEVVLTRNNLAIAYGHLGDHAAMATTLERVLGVYKTYYGPNHVEVANIESNLAVACAVTGALKQAQTLAEHAYQCYANTPGYGLTHPNARKIARLRQRISQKMASNIPLTQPRQAPDMLDGLIAALNAYQPQSPQPADTMRDLARAYQLKGDNTQAIACFRQSIATQPHPLTYVDLGYGLLRQQQPARALKYVSKVLALSLAKRQAHRVRYGWREVNTLFDDSLKACANSEGEVRLSITDWAYYIAIQCHRALGEYPQAQQQLAAWQSTATTSKAGRQLWQACQAELGPQTAAGLADTTKPTTPPMRLSQSQDTLFGHPETKAEPSPTEPAYQTSHPMTHQSQLSDKAPSFAPA